ncbi:hypothetical protein Tco_1542590 [Tanacetum coccineum]
MDTTYGSKRDTPTSKKSQSPKTPKSKKSTSKKSQSPKTPKSPIATPNVDAAQKGCSFRIAKQFAAEVLKNPKISYRQVMVANVREKFLINLWDYKDEILSTNPGSSVQLDVDTMDDGKTQFKRMYICLKGIERTILEDSKSNEEERGP